MRLFTIASYQSACHLHRCIWPFKHLRKGNRHEWLVGQSDPNCQFDALYLYGARAYSDWMEVASLKRRGIKFIWSIDDTLWNWPDWRHDQPTKENLASVNLACELADLIVASTPALALEVNKPTKTVVCPNLIEPALYRTPLPPADDDVIRIMWAGSATHKGDLDVMDGALCRIKEKWRDRAEFHFFGAGPDKLLRDWWGDGVHLTDWIPLNQYWWHLSQVKPHICLAPLVDCPFNRAKSGIRVQEGWALNAAVAASPVGEYRVVQNEVDGLIAHTEDEWFGQIDRLVGDRDLREKLAAEGRTTVSEWDWQQPEARQKWQGLVEWADACDSE